MTFLIAEDSRGMRASVKSFLFSRVPGQHSISEASDGAEAIELFEEVRPDWVLMDIMMEPLDGLTAARQIITAHPDAKIIMLTHFSDEQYRRAAKEAGVRAFVLKENLPEIRALILEK